MRLAVRRESLFSTRTGLLSMSLFLTVWYLFYEVICGISWGSIHWIEVNIFFCISYYLSLLDKYLPQMR